MDILIIFLTLLFLIILTFIIIGLRLWPWPQNLNFEESMADRFIQEAKTGDLLVFRHTGYYRWFIQGFTGYPWTHASFVERKEDDSIIIHELASYSRDKRGVISLELEEFATHNKMHTVQWLKYQGPDIDNFKLEQILNPIRDSKIKIDMFTLSQTLYRKPHYQDKCIKERIEHYYTSSSSNQEIDKSSKIIEDNLCKPDFFCTKFIIYLLQELEIIEKVWAPEHYQPHEILLRQLPYFEGISYDLPITIDLAELKSEEKDN